MLPVLTSFLNGVSSAQSPGILGALSPAQKHHQQTPEGFPQAAPSLVLLVGTSTFSPGCEKDKTISSSPLYLSTLNVAPGSE